MHGFEVNWLAVFAQGNRLKEKRGALLQIPRRARRAVA